jgi:sigma-E factor negative regulatory protein RseC
MHQEQISHSAIVQQVTSDGVEVVLDNTPGCDGCNAKSSCGLNPENQEDKGRETLFIPIGEEIFQPGELVEVSISPSLGLKAVLLGYVAPFILLITVLLISLNFFNELIAGLAALLVVGLFYVGLFFNKEKLTKTFAIDLKRFGS